MRINTHPYCHLLLLLFLGVAGPYARAQTPYDAEFSEAASGIREELQLFTDRKLYAVDEVIRFVAEHRLSGLQESTPWSSVLYLELLAPDAKIVAQGKYQLSGGKAMGSLQIPGDVLTGDYYLKAYTRWMRNKSAAFFSYTPVRIINPFLKEVATSDLEKAPSGNIQKVSYVADALSCRTTSSVYQGGEEVLIEVTGPSLAYLNQLRSCVTVVPAGAVDLFGGQLLLNFEELEKEPFRLTYLPDLGSGVSISGTVLGPDRKPEPYGTLHFSVLGEDPDYFATMSDPQGRFIFTPRARTGKQEFFVTPGQEEGSGLEVLIDQEYDSRPYPLPGPDFWLSDSEKELAGKMVMNMQLARAYSTPVLSLDAPVGPETKPEVEEDLAGKRIPFYGTRVKRLLIDDYVRLPNLEEIFINLVPDVQFYKKNGETRLRIMSDNMSIGVYEPLIMIDNISVFDHEAVLALSPEKIERIDLINEIYLKGNVAFGGVLAIHSRKGDMAGIDLPVGSYFFDFHSFYPDIPVNYAPPARDARIPDTRNTLLWMEDVLLEKGKQTVIPVQAPLSPGEYVILIRGVAPDGQVLSATSRFSVE